MEQLATIDGPERSVIVVAEKDRRNPQVARAVAAHPGLAMVSVPGPLTAVAMTDLVLRESDLGAAECVEVARALPPFLRTYAVLSSATKVEQPAPPFLTYLASLLPWTRFGLDLHEGRYLKPVDLPRVVPEAGVRIISAPTARFSTDLLPAGAAARDVALELPATSWGARHAVECTLLIGSVEDVVAQILSRDAVACVNCQVPTRLSLCPFCGVRQAPEHRKASA
ncbi:hypothetical protein [Ornithinimicrobium panacihumi]|uniref:hypothetical protein n=1 Tax=Ornithinimicrobium panacihumi TaxID=2008449 RepID=UPI003F899BDF